jgi:hypothetical protein
MLSGSARGSQLAHRADRALNTAFLAQERCNLVRILNRRQIIRRDKSNPNLVDGNSTMLRENLLHRILHGNRKIL